MVKMLNWDLGEEMGEERVALLNKYLSETPDAQIYWVEVFSDYNTLIVARKGLTGENVQAMYRNYFIESDSAATNTIFEATEVETGEIRYLMVKGLYADFEGMHVRCLCSDEEWAGATELEKLLYEDGFGVAFEEISWSQKEEILSKNLTVFVKITENF